MAVNDIWEMEDLLRDNNIDENEIIEILKNCPEDISKSKDLFLSCVFWNRFETAKEMVNLGVDIKYEDKGSLYRGNALNVAHSKEQAEWLLENGVEIERNLSVHISHPCVNPAIMAVRHNDANMVIYWLKKEKELFSNEEYISELLYSVTDEILTFNQSKTLSVLMKEDMIYEMMKEIYSKVDNLESIKLYQSSLRKISDEEVEDKKNELKKILSARKKQLV